MKNFRISLLLFSISIFCISSIAAEKKFTLENPSMLIERANQYIRESGIYNKIENEHFIKNIPENLQLKDMDFTEINYSISHEYANLSYYLKDYVKKIKMGNYGYNILTIKIDKFGKCRIASTGSCSDAGHNRKLIFSDDLEKIIKKANQYIADSNIGKKDISESSSENNPFQTKSAYIEKEIRKRIPEKINLDDLALLNIKNVSSGKGVLISYCMKNTVCEKGWRHINYKTISIWVDEKENCHNNGFGNVSGDIDNDRAPQKSPNISQNELENIYEAVFRYMFKDAANWNIQVNMRFLNANFLKNLSDKFFERFKDEKIPVKSPFKKCEDYKPDLFDGKYRPDGKDALFYSIDGVKEFDKTHVFVECSVTWAILAARGYIYTLEKKGDKWEVVEVERGWIS